MSMKSYTPEKLREILTAHRAWLKGEESGNKANLRGANLYKADLCRADLCRADLCGADLCGADLYKADLCRANLCGADLCRANLCGADLCGADLCGAKMNWDSHDLIAELLRQAAGEDVEKRKIAGLILVSRDWCWKQFLSIDEPLRDWALGVLAEYVREGDEAPAAVGKARVTQPPRNVLDRQDREMDLEEEENES